MKQKIQLGAIAILLLAVGVMGWFMLDKKEPVPVAEKEVIDIIARQKIQIIETYLNYQDAKKVGEFNKIIQNGN